MFNWIRKKRKVIIPAISVVFLGSMITFFCPHCLAKMEMGVNSAAIGHSESHCSHMGGGKQTVKTQSCCTGHYKCEEHTMVIEAKHSVTITDNKGKPVVRIAFLYETARSDLTITDSPFIIGRPYKPDRACFSPLERTCVLLN